ncbi:thermonuclease family protein [Nitrococcus mobilis]|uniref:SNase-like nuclease n=1 Tax=Nitrococcus mobilis Nb-231 TaxID=314278 RepID=A4BKX1_9GAMM|nr:thermonuclease family protein [Nitrococcus mobilis]EAR22959.1 SNase-like nuclease [Nitrococcus mobilis Nb-231]
MRFFLILLALLPNLVFAETLAGIPLVVDGDTLEIQGERIRLYGIDAPERAQPCYDSDGFPWRCGQKAAAALAARIGGQTVRCEGNERDRAGHRIAVCHLQGQDLNAWMVRWGWAPAYRCCSRAYLAEEWQAKAAGVGIWSGSFVMPWRWRSLWHDADTTDDKGYPGFGHQGAAGRFRRF